MLAAYLGSDPEACKSLALIASSLRQIDILDHRLLRAGRSAQIVIVDCREPIHDKHGRAKLSPEPVKLALVLEESLDRQAVFSNGYSDYLLWPLTEQEVLRRLTACIVQFAQRSTPPFFSADPIVQNSCSLLAQRVDQQITLVELARMVGTNRTTLTTRFETSFGCGPMTWLRRYRMTEAADRLRNGHESIGKVAESFSYENSNNFSTAFKAFHGLSPLRYRKMIRRREKPA
ncbi:MULTISPECIES: AraC family transcriptional regulator [unclassified Mesorhizobium]|uniref:helix-turn-helix domain-containing protein n=1 Tax=unclassified Mesorhizobium TaxID=325217 RepID=UPI0004CF6320|nr:AraC family transcriptional regulator [Mesorhizobium sp. LSHC420B00]